MPLQWLLGAACALSDPTAAVVDPSAANPEVVIAPSPATDPTSGVDRAVEDAAHSVVVSDPAEQAPVLLEVLGQEMAPLEVPSSKPAVTGGTASSAPMPRESEYEVLASRPASKRPKIRWLGPLGITGIVVGAVGLGGVAVSGVFLARGRTVEVDPADRTKLVITDYDRPGWVFYGVGLGVTAVGASALAIDVTVGRDRRARRMRLQPQLGRAQAGLTLRGRF